MTVFKPVSFQIVVAGLEFRVGVGATFNVGTTSAVEVFELSLDRSRRDEFNQIKITGTGPLRETGGDQLRY